METEFQNNMFLKWDYQLFTTASFSVVSCGLFLRLCQHRTGIRRTSVWFISSMGFTLCDLPSGRGIRSLQPPGQGKRVRYSFRICCPLFVVIRRRGAAAHQFSHHRTAPHSSLCDVAEEPQLHMLIHCGLLLVRAHQHGHRQKIYTRGE